MDKRTFVKQMSLLGLGASIPFMDVLGRTMKTVENIAPQILAMDEDFWAGIRAGYKLNPDYINLENGYYCMMPEETLQHYLEHVKHVNFLASNYMRTFRVENNNRARQKLAELAGSTFDEVIITRNATESLDMVIGGLHWQKGDEAVFALQDYGAMRSMFRLMEERFGIITKKVSLPNHPENDGEIVDLYAGQITEKTKLLMISHVVNITGQVLPVKMICDMAHERGVEVLVDGAHAFAHLDFKIPDLNCDYYGTSLHKWLSVPLGAGLLYVHKDKINKIWPLLAEHELPMDDIDRLNHIGTSPVHVILGIMNAIEYHNVIGSKRKEARLRYLKEYWTTEVKDHPNIIINTPFEVERSCAIANVNIEGMKAKDLAERLIEEYNIFVVPIDSPNVHGCRVTPNVFTSTDELDVLVKALNEMAR